MSARDPRPRPPHPLRALGVEAARRRADAASLLPPGELLALLALAAVAGAIALFLMSCAGCGGSFDLGTAEGPDPGAEAGADAPPGGEGGGEDGADAGPADAGPDTGLLPPRDTGPDVPGVDAGADAKADATPTDLGADGDGKKCVPGTIFGYPPGEDCALASPLDCCSGKCAPEAGMCCGRGRCL